MRIHRIRLRHYRGVRESEVSFSPTGVTIVWGENEVGKTSLAQAVDLIFDYRDDSTHRSVKATQPVGRDVGTEAEVEITSGQYRFVYAKRWHRQRQTTLEVLEPRREQLTGRQAHERVNDILEETLDRPLWRALRLEQGVGLGQPGLDVASLGQALDAAAGSAAADARTDALWDRICAERDRYWTPTGQPSKERSRLAAALDDARRAAGELEARLAGIEDDVDEVARLVSEASTLQSARAAQERAECQLEGRYAAIAELQTRLRQLEAQGDAARAVADGTRLRSERRAELIATLFTARSALADRRREADAATPLHAAADARHLRAVEVLHDARQARQVSEARHGLAVADRDHRRAEIELAQLTERHSRVLAAQARLVEADRLIESSRVDDDLVVRVEVAHLEVAKARAAAQAGAAVVRAEVWQPAAVEVDGRRRSLVPGGPTGSSVPIDEAVNTSFELTVPGQVRIEVRPGGEARALAERLAEAEEYLAALCAAAEVADLEEARVRANEVREARRSSDEAVTTIRQDLRDLTLEALAQKVDRLTARVADYRRTRSGEVPLPADFDLAQEQAGAIERQLVDCQSDLRIAEAEAEAAAFASQGCAVEDAGLAARLDQATAAVERAEHALAEGRREAADGQLAEAFASATASVRHVDTALAQLRSELASLDPGTVEDLLGNARAARERNAQALLNNRERRHALAVRIELLGEQGLGGDLDEALTRAEHLEREWRSLEARAEAARLLHHCFAQRRAEAHHRYVGPFRTKIEQLGRLVFGPTLEVELDDELRIATRSLEGTTVAFEQLSTGAQEQLGILSRLAAASLAAGEGGAPAIFDDALGWTDPQRLEGMGAAIAVAARHCQVIVFTSTPGRYAAVGSAEVVAL